MVFIGLQLICVIMKKTNIRDDETEVKDANLCGRSIDIHSNLTQICNTT